MGEQWWRPGVALFAVLATLFLTSLLGLGAAVAFSGAIGFVAGQPNPGAGIALIVLAVLVLVGGLRLAWRVGSGGLGDGMVRHR